VLDASALLAVLQLEAGGDTVADKLGRAHISSVNLCEVVSKLIDKGTTIERARHIIETLALSVEDTDEALAYAAAAMRSATRQAGLSLGDRMCLALGQRMGAEILTADKSWAKLNAGVTVTVIR
jgi:PIN domain nuclease of toxin-antitoxin system